MMSSKADTPTPLAPGRTALGKVRGLGPAHEGAEDWWHERLTSVAALALIVWLAISLLRLPGLDHRTIAGWLGSPLAAVPMLLLIVAIFWHLKLGLQVVIEDYVHEQGAKFFWIVLINFAAIFGATLGLFAVLKIAFAGAPA